MLPYSFLAIYFFGIFLSERERQVNIIQVSINKQSKYELHRNSKQHIETLCWVRMVMFIGVGTYLYMVIDTCYCPAISFLEGSSVNIRYHRSLLKVHPEAHASGFSRVEVVPIFLKNRIRVNS